MATARELLTKIAALRGRLDRTPTAYLDLAAVNSTNFDQPLPFTPPPAPPRLTFRAAQLLKDAKATLAELKTLADDPALQATAGCHQNLQREAAGLLDVILRNLLAMPTAAAAQLRHCEGLQTCFTAVRDKMHLLTSSMATERREDQAVELLATLLRRLVAGEDVGLGNFLEIARGVADEALGNVPLHFRWSAKNDAARFAAQHGLAVARIQARVLRRETRQRLAEQLIPALVHDVGMLSVSPDVLFKTTALDHSDRASLQQHVRESGAVLKRLFPGGGWPLDAILDHHERLDGSGYPFGKSALDLSEPARLLAACDVYAAMNSPRPQRPAFDSRTALADTLLLAEQGQLDRTQAEKLLRLSFYPVGAVVQLSDGAVALVVATPRNVVDPAKATVIPLKTSAGQAPLFPWPLDLTETNDLSIVRALTARERAQTLGATYPSLASFGEVV